MSRPSETLNEPRRGQAPADEAYLKNVGERVRLQRARRGMSRKVLSQASGVSERYLAELERGAGNASLLVLRQIASAMETRISDLVTEGPDRPIDLSLAIQHLERLDAREINEARRILEDRFGRPIVPNPGRIALIGARGSGRRTLAQDAGRRLGLPVIELDREIERATGLDLAEIFATRGEAAFRKYELDCLEAVIEGFDRAIIVTGGSIVAEPRTYDLLLATCYVVWIKASPAQIRERLVREGELHALALPADGMVDQSTIVERRDLACARAHDVIDTTEKSPAQAVEALLGLVRGQGLQVAV